MCRVCAGPGGHARTVAADGKARSVRGASALPYSTPGRPGPAASRASSASRSGASADPLIEERDQHEHGTDAKEPGDAIDAREEGQIRREYFCDGEGKERHADIPRRPEPPAQA